MDHSIENECFTCDEAGGLIDPVAERCAKTERTCGHHCNHSWTHDHCCWCDRSWDTVGDY